MKIFKLLISLTFTSIFLFANDSTVYKQLPTGVAVGTSIDTQITTTKIKIGTAKNYTPPSTTTLQKIKYLFKAFYNANTFLTWVFMVGLIIAIFKICSKIFNKLH